MQKNVGPIIQYYLYYLCLCLFCICCYFMDEQCRYMQCSVIFYYVKLNRIVLKFLKHSIVCE